MDKANLKSKRPSPKRDSLRVAYLGPAGSFSEEALLGASLSLPVDPVEASTIPEAIEMADTYLVDAAFVPIENSIEGSVNVTLDELIFASDLFITAEVVFNVHLQLLAKNRIGMDDIARVLSYPVAAAQCRDFLAREMPQAILQASSSTSEAARMIAQTDENNLAAVAPLLASQIYGLKVIKQNIEDHSHNQTRFVLLEKKKIPAKSDLDKTTIVCFQKKDKPGSLYSIVGQFAARNINLVRIESRPTKKALGDYCFVIELEGHVTDDIVGDCLKELYMELGHIKFLGSYPVYGKYGKRQTEINTARLQATQWLEELTKYTL